MDKRLPHGISNAAASFGAEQPSEFIQAEGDQSWDSDGLWVKPSAPATFIYSPKRRASNFSGWFRIKWFFISLLLFVRCVQT
jgi:hypothetical protein